MIMYDFLYSEVWWMETATIAIITALITAIATVIGVALVYNYKVKTIFKGVEEIKAFKDVFMNEHGSLSKEHNDLSKENRTLNFDLRECIGKVEHQIIEYVAKDEVRYDNLSEKQKDIVSTVVNVQAMSNEIKFLASENKNVLKDNKELWQDNNSLLQYNKTLILELEKSKEELQDLRSEMQKMQKNMDTLSKGRKQNRDLER